MGGDAKLKTVLLKRENFAELRINLVGLKLWLVVGLVRARVNYI